MISCAVLGSGSFVTILYVVRYCILSDDLGNKPKSNTMSKYVSKKYSI